MAGAGGENEGGVESLRECRDGLGLHLGVGGVQWVLCWGPRWRLRRVLHVCVPFLSAQHSVCAAWQENTMNPELRTIRCCSTITGFACNSGAHCARR